MSNLEQNDVNTTPKAEVDFKNDNYFKFQSLGTTLKKEILGGLSTFLALIYIVSVQSSLMHETTYLNGTYVSQASIFFLACLVIGTCTILMGFISNLPVAVAPGMGLNATFTFSIANSGGLHFEGALIATMISSILFTIFAYTKLRELIVKALPDFLHIAIGVGLGFFIAYVGLSNMGWVASDGTHAVAALGDIKGMYPSIILGTSLLFLMLFLNHKKVPGAVAIPMVIGLAIAIPMAFIGNGNDSFISNNFGKKLSGWSYGDMFNLKPMFKNIYTSFGNVDIWKSPTLYVGSFIFLLVSIFDTAGVLSICSVGMSEKKEYRELVIKKGLRTVAPCAIAASLVGISPTIITLESNVGIQQGGRSGLTAVILGACFIAIIPLYPVLSAIPQFAIGAASTFIGIMMASHLKDLDFKKPEVLVSVFMLVIFMVITQDITNGVAIGIISYILMCTMTGKVKNVSPTLWVLGILFIAYFASHAFI